MAAKKGNNKGKADKDQVQVSTAAPQEPEAKNSNNTGDAPKSAASEPITDEQIENQQKAKAKAIGTVDGDDVKTYYSGIADMNISSPKASAIFDQNGFYKTNNPAEIEMLDEKVANGLIQDRTPVKAKATKPAETATSLTDLEYLRDQATKRGISWSEDNTIDQLRAAIDEHNKANPADAGKVATTTVHNKK